MGGHALTLSAGAAKKTTSAGVRFNGTANSYIACGVINEAAASLWVSLRFRLTQAYAAGGGNMYLMEKSPDGTHFLQILLSTADGQIHFVHNNEAGALFDISVGAGTLLADTWYNVVASISAANGARLRLDNGTAATNADVTAGPTGGNLTFGNQSTPGTSGLVGVMQDIFVGTADITASQEADVYKGVPPLLAVNMYFLDEGCSLTANDLGSGAANATLGTACVWVFDTVMQPVIGMDGIDSIAASSGSKVGRAITIICVIKAKSTYNALSNAHPSLHFFAVDETTQSIYFYYTQATNAIRLFYSPSAYVASSYKPAIGEYLILIGALIPGTSITFYLNGALVGTTASVGRCGNANTTIRIGGSATSTTKDPSKHLFDAISEGAMTAAQALAYSRWLNQQLGLGLTI
jgi:hypothetical protein